MEITTILEKILSNIDFPYMFAVNLLTYFWIKFVDDVNGAKSVDTWAKRGIALLSGLLLSIPVYYLSDTKPLTLLYSFILSLFSWDWIFKPIVKKLKADYRKD